MTARRVVAHGQCAHRRQGDGRDNATCGRVDLVHEHGQREAGQGSRRGAADAHDDDGRNAFVCGVADGDAVIGGVRLAAAVRDGVPVRVAVGTNEADAVTEGGTVARGAAGLNGAGATPRNTAPAPGTATIEAPRPGA